MPDSDPWKESLIKANNGEKLTGVSATGRPTQWGDLRSIRKDLKDDGILNSSDSKKGPVATGGGSTGPAGAFPPGWDPLSTNGAIVG